MDCVENVGHVLSAPPVAVIGGGYAGMAAAVKLAELNIASVVFESSKVLGGRARRVDYRGTKIDNGQHILSGAYTELLRMMALVGVSDSAFEQVRLRLDMTLDTRLDKTGGQEQRAGSNSQRHFSLHAPILPAPLHLVWALLAAKGLDWAERLAAIRLIRALKKSNFKCDPNQTVAALLAAYEQPQKLITVMWEPLTVSALNTPIDSASAQVLANVLRDTLAASRAASDLILPNTDLSALFPEPAAHWLSSRGSIVRAGSRVSSIACSTAGSGGFEIVCNAETMLFQSVVLAVGPHQVGRIASPLLIPPNLQYEPIYTVYLQYPSDVELPIPMLGCTGKLTQWFFDRGQLIKQQANDGMPEPSSNGLIAAVISASGAHEAIDHAALATRVHDELSAILGAIPVPIWHKVVAEKFATFSCTPVIQNTARPSTETHIDGLFLAGDYIACDYPATLEAAVRNGAAAAILAAKFLSKPRHD